MYALIIIIRSYSGPSQLLGARGSDAFECGLEKESAARLPCIIRAFGLLQRASGVRQSTVGCRCSGSFLFLG